MMKFGHLFNKTGQNTPASSAQISTAELKAEIRVAEYRVCEGVSFLRHTKMCALRAQYKTDQFVAIVTTSGDLIAIVPNDDHNGYYTTLDTYIEDLSYFDQKVPG